MIHNIGYEKFVELNKQERIDYCNAVLNEHRELIKPFDAAVTEAYHKKDKAAYEALQIVHNFARIAHNLSYYISTPKYETNDGLLQFQTVTNLISINAFLECINTYIIAKQQPGNKE